MSVCAVNGCGRVVQARRWCHGHYEQWRRTGVEPTVPFPETVEQRFFAKVDKRPDGCWLWRGAIGSSGRYGNFKFRGGPAQAHRVAYELLVAPIPDGLVLDHLCRVTLCVNPEHLEPVTQVENIRRGESPWHKQRFKTHCKHGHEFTPENTRVSPKGYRKCRTCERYAGSSAQRRERAARREAS